MNSTINLKYLWLIPNYQNIFTDQKTMHGIWCSIHVSEQKIRKIFMVELIQHMSKIYWKTSCDISKEKLFSSPEVQTNAYTSSSYRMMDFIMNLISETHYSCERRSPELLNIICRFKEQVDFSISFYTNWFLRKYNFSIRNVKCWGLHICRFN